MLGESDMSSKLVSRILYHLWKNGTFWIGFDHFFAMFPATVLMPLLINYGVGANVIDISLALLTSGVGTLAFLIFTKGRIPAYLGSSFTFIGFSVFMISDMQESTGEFTAFSYIFWAYAFAAILLFALSFLYKIKNFDKWREFVLPTAVLGPSVSLIGLGLVGSAATNAGFYNGVNVNHAVIAAITFATVVVLSVKKRKFLKNTYVLASIALGTIFAAVFFEEFRSFEFLNAPLFVTPSFSLPLLQIPPNPLMLFLSVIPPTLLIFTENMSRVIIINGLKRQEKAKEGADWTGGQSITVDFDDSRISTKGQAISIFIASFFGSVPNTLYAENIAVMSIGNNDAKDREKPTEIDHPAISQINKTTSWVPYVIAAALACLASIIGPLYQFLNLDIPRPVMGGIGLFLFGIIAAPGIQLLVQGRVNYKKISNQILTASVLVAGISNIRLDFGLITLSGMSLGLVIGIVLNLFFRFLRRFNWLNEAISFGELLDICMGNFGQLKILRIGAIKPESKLPPESADDFTDIFYNNLQSDEYLQQSKISKLPIEGKGRFEAEKLIDTIYNSTYIEITDGTAPILILKRSDSENLYIYIKDERLPDHVKSELKTDYKKCVEQENEYMRILIDGELSIQRIKRLTHDVWSRNIV
jgi:uracil permease